MSFYTVARSFVKGVSYLFFPIKYHGDLKEIPSDSGVILCANHLSYLDAVFLGLVTKRHVHFVAKKKYAEMFILKHIIKWLGAFGIDTDKPDIGALRKCFQIVKSNEVLGIFPEGTRVRGGKVSDPMPGTTMIAHRTKTPIFYVRIKPRKKFFRLFVPTDVYLGKLVTVDELGVTDGKGSEYKDASVKLLERIYDLGE